jgi:hypothetical protein
MVPLRNDVPTELHTEKRGALTEALLFCADLAVSIMERRGNPLRKNPEWNWYR